MAVSNPLLTEFSIHHRLESCEPFRTDVLPFRTGNIIQIMNELEREVMTSTPHGHFCFVKVLVPVNFVTFPPVLVILFMMSAKTTYWSFVSVQIFFH